MTNEELLGVIERNLRKRRVSARQTASLLRQRERILKKMGRGRGSESPRVLQPTSEFTEPQQRVLRGDSLLGTLSDEDRIMWESIYRSENEKRAKPTNEPQSTAAGMTVADSEAYLRSQHGRGVANPRPTQPEVKADVE